MAQDLATGYLNIKAQTALDSPESGAGATQIPVVSSRGIAHEVAEIQSQLIKANRMRNRPRFGSNRYPMAYETELAVGRCDLPLTHVLGASAMTAAADYSNTDWGSLTISGTGVTLTFASGTLLTDGVRAGMMIKFTNLSEAENNDVWAPILTVDSETVMTVMSGYLADNAEDAAWDGTVAKHAYTPATYVKTYNTVEENLADADASKLVADAVAHEFTCRAQPNSPTQFGWSMLGRSMTAPTGAGAPVFTSPTLVQAENLISLDGAIIANGVARTDLTGLTFGLRASASTVDMLATRTSPDIFVSSFDFVGEFSALVSDLSDFATSLAETQVSLMLIFRESQADASPFTSFYIGNLAFAGFSTPLGGEGGMQSNVRLVGGEDVRTAAAGFAPTTILVSTG